MVVAPAVIAVRPAKPSDAAAFAKIHAAAWREAYIGILPQPTLDTMIGRRGPAHWAGALKRAENFRVIVFDGNIAGYTSFGPARDRAVIAKSEIYEIYLAPEYQGVGLGRRLFDESCEAAVKTHGAGVVVWVLMQNQRALAFYRALGGRIGLSSTERLGNIRLEKVSFFWP